MTDTSLLRKMLAIAIFGSTQGERENARTMAIAQMDKLNLPPDFSWTANGSVWTNLSVLSLEDLLSLAALVNAEAVRRSEQQARQTYNTSYGFRTTTRK